MAFRANKVRIFDIREDGVELFNRIVSETYVIAISQPISISLNIAKLLFQSVDDIGERMHTDLRVHDVHHAAGKVARGSVGRFAAVRRAFVLEHRHNGGWVYMVTGMFISNSKCILN